MPLIASVWVIYLKLDQNLLVHTPMGFSGFYIMTNWMFLGFGLLFGHNEEFEDITLGSKVWQAFFFFFFVFCIDQTSNRSIEKIINECTHSLPQTSVDQTTVDTSSNYSDWLWCNIICLGPATLTSTPYKSPCPAQSGSKFHPLIDQCDKLYGRGGERVWGEGPGRGEGGEIKCTTE